MNSRNVEEINIPSEKREEILNELRQILKKWNTNDSTISKFVTKKSIEINDLSGGHYSANKYRRLKTSILRSYLCDYGDAYIVLKEVINVRAIAYTNINKKDAAFKSNTPFRSCITKIINTLIDNAEDLDIVMPMYNILEYGHNYFMTSGSFWNNYRDEIDCVYDDVSESKSSNCKAKMIGETPA